MATKKATTPAKGATKKTTEKAAAKPAVKKVAAKTATSKTTITVEAIRRRAEEIFHARQASGKPGTPDSDWLQAEKELKAKKK